ncbi:MAG: bifunctional dTDP-4-dehydrorhamnose 3,5-epimerase family protein/NAD(P)-dependent oxidoreductase [Propionibacteriaceae bacterium]
MAKAVRTTPIPGLLVIDLDLRGDNRGWFKENWQRQKLLDLGLGDFGPVQNNVSFNALAGATRGIHAEPWDKLVSLATGRIFGAWVDLRAGESFGRVFTLEMGPDTAVFVPRGVGNAFQTLEDATAYSYLVNDHWSLAAKESYTFVNLADETLAISWPIPLERAELSAADKAHPRLADVVPMPDRKTLILGASGQLGRALSAAFPDADAVGRAELDVTDPAAVAGFDWAGYGVVVNAAAYTAVDAAETHEGRRQAWATNVSAVRALVTAARRNRLTLVHISSDYVFDGTVEEHDEDEPFSPLGVYGQTKAAGDALVASLDAHYTLRTSWVIGDGKNFVRTMASLADRELSPGVVADQYGRLTFTTEIVRALQHLLDVGAPYGTYNVTNSGPAVSWADIASTVFEARGRAASDVSRVTTEAYGADKSLAPRPQHSVLSLDKIQATGFVPVEASVSLKEYLSGLSPV